MKCPNCNGPARVYRNGFVERFCGYQCRQGIKDGKVKKRREKRELKQPKKPKKKKRQKTPHWSQYPIVGAIKGPTPRTVLVRPSKAPSTKDKLALYDSREWRELRYKVLKKSDGRCLLCSSGRRERIVLHVDHIKPLSKFWELRLDINNLQVLCEDCNKGKSNTDDTDWRQEEDKNGRENEHRPQTNV